MSTPNMAKDKAVILNEMDTQISEFESDLTSLSGAFEELRSKALARQLQGTIFMFLSAIFFLAGLAGIGFFIYFFFVEPSVLADLFEQKDLILQEDRDALETGLIIVKILIIVFSTLFFLISALFNSIRKKNSWLKFTSTLLERALQRNQQNLDKEKNTRKRLLKYLLSSEEKPHHTTETSQQKLSSPPSITPDATKKV